MELGLEGKTALVAASSRGLGRAVAEEMAREGANLVICARTVAPLDEEAIINSVAKTGRLVVADPAWRSFGVSAEIIPRVVEGAPNSLKAPASSLSAVSISASVHT